MIKKVNEIINKFWQSNRKDMGDRSLLWFSIFCMPIDLICIINFFLTTEIIERVFYGYIALAFTFGVITLSITYFYVYNTKNFPSWIVKILQYICKSILLLFFFICIPGLIILSIIQTIVDKRAKRIENLLNLMMLVLIDMFVILVFKEADLLIAAFLATYFEVVSNGIIHIEPVIVFVVLVLVKAEIDIFNAIIFKVVGKFGTTKISKQVLKKQFSTQERLPANVDIKEYMKNKKERIEIFQNTETENLKYDLEYLRKTLWKIQLFFIVLLFAIATFAPKVLPVNQSDLINVITIFTLIILYLDKRKEWK